MEIRTFKTFEFKLTPTEKDSMEEVSEKMKELAAFMEKEEIWSFVKEDTGELFEADEVMRVRGLLNGLLEGGKWEILS